MVTNCFDFKDSTSWFNKLKNNSTLGKQLGKSLNMVEMRHFTKSTTVTMYIVVSIF